MEPEDSNKNVAKVKFVKKDVIVCSECKKNYYLQQINEKKYICN